MWRALYFEFLVQGNVIDEEAMTGFILHQSNPPCRDVDTNKELKPCTLSSLEDYQGLRYGDPSCPAAQGQTGCKDGSYNMTCMPLSLQVEYLCACAEVRVILTRESHGMTLGKKSAGTSCPSSAVCVIYKLAGVWM